MIFSKSLAITGNTDTGPIIDLSAQSPSLKIGVTLANFQDSGNILVSIDVLNTIVREFSINGKASFKKKLEMLATLKPFVLCP